MTSTEAAIPTQSAPGPAPGEATLRRPAGTWAQRGGRQGRHSEHLGFLLAEMQHLQRTHPGARW